MDFSSICETVLVVMQMYTKDRMERKKYMGVCRWESETVAKMMSRFPSTVSRYMDRNSPKKTG
jgi:IS30 family transposase